MLDASIYTPRTRILTERAQRPGEMPYVFDHAHCPCTGVHCSGKIIHCCTEVHCGTVPECRLNPTILLYSRGTLCYQSQHVPQGRLQSYYPVLLYSRGRVHCGTIPVCTRVSRPVLLYLHISRKTCLYPGEFIAFLASGSNPSD